jgi:hypothetical protein
MAAGGYGRKVAPDATGRRLRVTLWSHADSSESRHTAGLWLCHRHFRALGGFPRDGSLTWQPDAPVALPEKGPGPVGKGDSGCVTPDMTPEAKSRLGKM